MKNLIYYFSVFVITGVLLYSCISQPISHPQPTDTIVNFGNEEDEGNALKRELWIESMHRTAPNQNWREIERQNAFNKLKSQNLNRSSNMVVLGDSLYTGTWEERGSNNQAGSVIAVNYLQETDKIYTISAGGTLWRGQLDGDNWEVINESFVFDNRTLEFVDLPNNQKRMIVTIARIPHFSDDMGQSWTAASGITSSGDFWSRTANFETVVMNDGSLRIYCLAKDDFWSNIKLFYSDDLGESYQELADLAIRDFDNLAFCKPHHSNELLIGRTNFTRKLLIQKLNSETNVLEAAQETDVTLNDIDDRIILIGNYLNQDSVLYAVQDEDELMKSSDAGLTWERMGTFSNNPWEVGFYVTPSNSSQVFYGEVEAHRLRENFFTTVNRWWEYYDDVENYIHADIMSYNEFEDTNGNPFVLIGNHGGLSISRDYLETTQNISLEGLNVAQYYDVRTDPNDPNFCYAGSQDQGFQRASNMTSTGHIDFDQVISGDYGHITFSRSGEGMWMVFPGGTVDYYRDPQNGFSTDSYEIVSENESTWLPAMADIPGTTRNEILMAGGNITGEAGSHLIKLEYFAGVNAEQMPFDFYAESGGGVLSAIEVSTIDPNIIYTATTNGSFFTSRDGGQTFDISFNIVNNGHFLYGASIYASTINENEVWIAGSGYNGDGVFYSDDYGQNFTLFSQGLPSTLVFEIAANADETQFYAATEAGPYVYLTETGAWEDLSQGNTPAHTYWSVEYIESLDLVRFGTYGRGIWDFTFQQESVSVIPTSLPLHNFADVFPNPVVDFLTIEFDQANTTSLRDVSLNLYNINGQLLISRDANTDQDRLDLSSLASGNYTLQISDGEKMQVEKVLKK